MPGPCFPSRRDRTGCDALGGLWGSLALPPVTPEHQQLSQSSLPNVALGEEEPDLCHCWLHWANFSWGGENWSQISSGEGRTAPKTPLPWCPLLSHTPGGGTTGNLHQTPGTEGAGRAQGFGAAISGVPSCQCQPRWGSLGLGPPLFPPHSPPLAPSQRGWRDGDIVVGAGKLGVCREGVKVTPPP